MTPAELVHATRVEEAHHGRGEDRVAVAELDDRTILVVADGAGGVAGGAAAADEVCAAVVEQCRRGVPADWSEWLVALDRAMAGSQPGLAAAVVAEVRDDGRVGGASVGDCQAWLYSGDVRLCLTERQSRKPLLGEGTAEPIPFAVSVGRLSTILLASDGLWSYMSGDRIAAAAAVRPLEAAVVALVDGVRLRSGALQDDVAIAICELRLGDGP